MRWFEHMPDKRAGLIEKGMEIMTAGNSAKAVGKIPHYTLTISIKRKKKIYQEGCLQYEQPKRQKPHCSIANRQLSSNERQPSQIDVL